MTADAASPTETSAPGVLVVGSVSADVTTFSHRLPAPGETILGDVFTLVLGGKGGNQAISAARAGAKSRFVGCVGNDLFRDLVVGGLAEAGVDIAQVRTVDDQTGIAHIRVDEDGENNIVVVPLANSHLSEAHVDEAFAEFAATSSVFLTQLEIPFAITMHAIRRAAEHGLTVILDPAPAHELDPEIWQLVDIVTPNETEASLLTGVPVTDVASAVTAGEWFLKHGVRTAVITLASAGSVVVTADGHTIHEPYRVEVVDTTAAGDAYAGYLAASLAQGLSFDDALLRASAAGALAVTRSGASPSLPHGDAVAEFQASQPR